jgi:hypothetical protein
MVIENIANRAARTLNMPHHRMTFSMDLELCHSQNSLRLQEMLIKISIMIPANLKIVFLRGIQHYEFN